MKLPARSKFNRRTAARVVELTVAGASRREIARRIGVHHTQLQRWLERGERQRGTGTRWDRFAEAMRLAQDAHDPPRLVALRDMQVRWETDPSLAMRYLERSGELEPDPPPEPVQIEVVFAQPTEGDQA